jgi:NADPH:quinone reductase-like Zn-dependent oxidoreductase
MSTTTLPKEQLGVLTTPTSNALQNFPVPEPGPNEVLVRNIAVASNPKDWKVPQRFGDYSSIEGNDIAGYVAKVGEGVTEYKGGERVAAFTKMATLDPKVCYHRNVHLCAHILNARLPHSTAHMQSTLSRQQQQHFPSHRRHPSKKPRLSRSQS